MVTKQFKNKNIQRGSEISFVGILKLSELKINLKKSVS